MEKINVAPSRLSSSWCPLNIVVLVVVAFKPSSSFPHLTHTRYRKEPKDDDEMMSTLFFVVQRG